MTMNKENQMNQIPVGVLQNIDQMLSFGDNAMSDEDGRLTPEELTTLREEMSSKLDLVCEEFIAKLENIYKIKLESKKSKMTVLSVFHDFGLKLIKKLSTRYQNAHVRITFKTVTGYVYEEIQESEVTSMIENIMELLQNEFNLVEKTSYVSDIMKEQLKELEENFKSINIPSEHKDKKDARNELLDINNPQFVENTVKHVENLLDNEGKNAMLKYVQHLAEKISNT